MGQKQRLIIKQPCDRQACKYYTTAGFCTKFNSKVYPYADPPCIIPRSERNVDLVDNQDLILNKSDYAGLKQIKICVDVSDKMISAIDAVVKHYSLSRAIVVRRALKEFLTGFQK